MVKCRIIQRTCPDGRVEHVIQQKHYLFRWWWVDAWVNSSSGPACRDSYRSLDEAIENLVDFDGSKCEETVLVAGQGE